jgi:hypothetical protein
VQDQAAVPEDLLQIGGQRFGQLAELGEDQHALAFLIDGFADLAQAGELAALLFINPVWPVYWSGWLQICLKVTIEARIRPRRSIWETGCSRASRSALTFCW